MLSSGLVRMRRLARFGELCLQMHRRPMLLHGRPGLLEQFLPHQSADQKIGRVLPQRAFVAGVPRLQENHRA